MSEGSKIATAQSIHCSNPKSKRKNIITGKRITHNPFDGEEGEGRGGEGRGGEGRGGEGRGEGT